jgi:DNA (cytosine-5)-methyltransferase 1
VILDLFAGPGGWSEGLRRLSPELHATELGIETDAAACATRKAAGHETLEADVAALSFDRWEPGQVLGLIASPPCQDFSLAGKRAGIEGERGQLIWEVMRYARELAPTWIACEQVPLALPIWRDFARELESLGYWTWCGVLNAADYGVPQTRRRAFLIASKHGRVAPPAPTHDEHPAPSLFGGELKPWVTMADALGWGAPEPSHTLCAGTHGAPDPFLSGGQTVRARIIEEIRDGKWIVNIGQAFKETGNRDTSLKFDPNERPALTLTGKSGNQWWLERPATCVVGSFRPDILAGPGVDLSRPRQEREGSVKITPTDALVLQSFPANYPLQGSKTKQFEQVGNAVPPRLAAHVLAAVLGITYEPQ